MERYAPFVHHPDALYGLNVYPANGKFAIAVSENPFAKNEQGNHPKEHNLGDIAKGFATKGGGHKGIGVIPKLSKEQADEVKGKLLEMLK